MGLQKFGTVQLKVGDDSFLGTPPLLGSWHTCQATGGPQNQLIYGSR